jgi:predicted alpha/beta hydrolase
MIETTIPAIDGLELAATLYDPAAGPARRVVIVNSATAVPRAFYRRFAVFLAKHDYSIVTYDYRGIGGSRPASLRGFPATMRDWGLLDMAGALRWVNNRYRPSRLFVIGHSVGGQLMGLLPNAHLVDGMLCTSAQSGYWKIQGGAQKWLVGASMYLAFPLLPRLFGYFPWTWFGATEDLPGGVALEWSRWCRSPHYMQSAADLPELSNFAGFDAPILAYSFSDDDWGTAHSVDRMMEAYTGAPVERRHVSPAEVGMKQIGHFGFYRSEAEPLWKQVCDWLNDLSGDGHVRKARSPVESRP